MQHQYIDWGECVKTMRDESADMVKREKACSLVCAKRLEHFGYTQKVAGDIDFFNAVRAYTRCCLATKPKRRGICVQGESGCGKTTLLNAIRAQMSISQRFFRLSQYRDMLALDTHDENNAEWMRGLMRMNVFLDDVGAESDVNDYGVRYNVVTDFIMRYNDERESHAEAVRGDRLNDRTKNFGRLLISTNLTDAQLLEKYGDRVCDRIASLCVILKLKGESKRALDVFEREVETPQNTTIEGRA